MATDTPEWRTRVEPELAARYGVDELHVVLFEPDGDRPGTRNVVGVQIPEASRQQIREAIKQANKRRARVIFFCDTGDQADEMAVKAGEKLPHHHRIAYERAEAGEWGLHQ
jgi:hypothetical protein